MYKFFLIVFLIVILVGCKSDSQLNENENSQEITQHKVSQGDEVSRAEAIKFLKQASLSIREKDIDFIMKNGYESWINEQFKKPFTSDKSLLTRLYKRLTVLDKSYSQDMATTTELSKCDTSATPKKFRLLTNSLWWQRAFDDDDQLRQKVAYVLSQIIVVSNTSPAGNTLLWRGEAMANYYDILQKDAFLSYKQVLKDITYSPAMAYYMTYIGSAEYNITRGTSPDENYARELMQLFSLGINKLNIDGTAVLKNGREVPIYSQNDVAQNARIFTGWDLQGSPKFGRITKKSGCYTLPIRFNEKYHDKGEKTTLGQMIPANQTGEKDIESLLNVLMKNKNMAPYIAKALIVKMTTSNPSPAYIKRVATVFNNNGTGKKGDLKAVVKAILLDPEAREVGKNSGRVDELLTSLTHVLSILSVKPTAYWKFYNAKVVKDKPLYWIATSGIFAQAPMSAPDVFNYYSTSFIPNDENFTKNLLVAPETQIQTSKNLIRYSNFIATLLASDIYGLIHIDKKYSNYDELLEGQLSKRSHSSSALVYVDLTSIYHKFEEALDGKADDDFSALNNEADLEKALIVLVDELDRLFLGNTMPKEYKKVIVEELKKVKGYDNKLPFRARKIVTNAIRIVVTSPFYMVIR